MKIVAKYLFFLENTEQKQVRRDYQEDFPALGGSSQSYSKPVEKETPVSSYQGLYFISFFIQF